jgi:hypothetical protein
MIGHLSADNPCPLCGRALFQKAEKWFVCHNSDCQTFMRIFIVGDDYDPEAQRSTEKLGPLFRRTK